VLLIRLTLSQKTHPPEGLVEPMTSSSSSTQMGGGERDDDDPAERGGERGGRGRERFGCRRSWRRMWRVGEERGVMVGRGRWVGSGLRGGGVSEGREWEK